MKPIVVGQPTKGVSGPRLFLSFTAVRRWTHFFFKFDTPLKRFFSLFNYINMRIHTHTHTHTHRERERGGDAMINYRHFKLLIWHMCFICLRFCLRCIWVLCERKAALWDNSRKLEKAVAHGIHNWSFNTKISTSDCQSLHSTKDFLKSWMVLLEVTKVR